MVPLTLAYAISIHKSQGQTLDQVIINPGSDDFSRGLLFVALSRVRRVEAIQFTSLTKDRIGAVFKNKDYQRRQLLSELQRLKQLALQFRISSGYIDDNAQMAQEIQEIGASIGPGVSKHGRQRISARRTEFAYES